MTRPVKSAVLLWALAQAVMLGSLFHADTATFALLLPVLAVMGYLFAVRGVGIILYPLIILVAGSFLYCLEEVFGASRLTRPVILTAVLLSVIAGMWLVKGFTASHHRLIDCELPALTLAFLLVMEWPHRSGLDYLGVLRYEDNASWIGMAGQFISPNDDPIAQGLGAAVLRAFISIVGLVMSGLSQPLELSDAYRVVGISFRLLIFVSSALAGIAVARLMPQSSRITRVLVSLAGTAVAYALFGLPFSTGHLTFIGALMFLWAYVALPQEDDSEDRRIILVGFLLLLGAAGMWWPLAPLLVGAVLFIGPRQPWFARFVTTFREARLAVRIGVALLCGGLVVAGIFLVTRWLPMDFRSFFQIKGGVQEVPVDLFPLALMGVFAGVAWRGLRPLNERWSILTTTVICYTFAVVAIARYVGPDFALNYSPRKMLLLLALFLAPFMILLPVSLFRRRLRPLGLMGIAGCVLVAQSWMPADWSWSGPPLVAAPRWGESILDIADSEEATILCLSAKAERRGDAWQCTRHAASLTNFEFDAVLSWGHLMIFPGEQNFENEVRVAIVRQAIEKELSEGRKVVLLSLDSRFAVSTVDSWWMPTLPRSRDATVSE